MALLPAKPRRRAAFHGVRGPLPGSLARFHREIEPISGREEDSGGEASLTSARIAREQNCGVREFETKSRNSRLTLAPAAAMAVALRPFWRLVTAVSVATIFTAALSAARATALARAWAVELAAGDPQSADWEWATPARAASTSEQRMARRDMVIFFKPSPRGRRKRRKEGSGRGKEVVRRGERERERQKKCFLSFFLLIILNLLDQTLPPDAPRLSSDVRARRAGALAVFIARIQPRRRRSESNGSSSDEGDPLDVCPIVGFLGEGGARLEGERTRPFALPLLLANIDTEKRSSAPESLREGSCTRSLRRHPFSSREHRWATKEKRNADEARPV